MAEATLRQLRQVTNPRRYVSGMYYIPHCLFLTLNFMMMQTTTLDFEGSLVVVFLTNPGS